MPDITMCRDDDCPIRKTCRRHAASGTKPDRRQSFFVGSPRLDGACGYYWPTSSFETPTTYDFGDGPVPAHRHEYGGGWVADTAKVEDSVYIAPEAKVFDNAKVCDNAQVLQEARVYGDAKVYGNAVVFGKAKVFGETLLSQNAQVSGNALVYGNTLIGGDVHICGDSKLEDGSFR